MGEAFTALVETYQNMIPEAKFSDNNFRLVDSMPIIMAQQGRGFKAKVASEIADKNGYCASKKLHYYGVKLHIVTCAQEGTIPIPENIGVLLQEPMTSRHMSKFCLKFYNMKNLLIRLIAVAESLVQKLIPQLKKIRGRKDYLDATDSLYSTAIARIRQPIEPLNNWIEERAPQAFKNATLVA